MPESDDKEEFVRVAWYDHDCDWLTKYCDENHRKFAWIPMSVVRQYASG